MEADPLISHMEQWEIHALRAIVGVMLVEVQLFARTHDDARDLAARLLAIKRNHNERQLLELQQIVVHDVIVERLQA